MVIMTIGILAANTSRLQTPSHDHPSLPIRFIFFIYLNIIFGRGTIKV